MYVQLIYCVFNGKNMCQNVNKSQKHFFETPLPKKQTKYLTKFCPSFIGQNFVKYFVCFLGNGVSRKIAFDIYWPLALRLFGQHQWRRFTQWKWPWPPMQEFHNELKSFQKYNLCFLHLRLIKHNRVMLRTMFSEHIRSEFHLAFGCRQY